MFCISASLRYMHHCITKETAMQVEWSEVLNTALRAGEDAYRAQWTKEGCRDRGWCGYAQVAIPVQHQIAKHAVKVGLADRPSLKGRIWLNLSRPADLPAVQSMNINEARAEAVRDALEAAGVEGVNVRRFND